MGSAVAAPEETRERIPFLLRPHWGGPDGVRRLLAVAVPLIATHALHSTNMFFDRLFLAWYGAEEFAAALQAGTLFWTTAVLFFATIMYASTLAAQYLGAEQDHQVGPVVWQAMYLGIIGAIIIGVLSPLVYPLFAWVGHEGNLPLLEAQYFQTLSFGAIVLFLNSAIYSFFAAQGRTMFILAVTLVSCILNICFNSFMIFEPVWFFPEGIRGAAWATNLATLCGFLLFWLFVLVRREYQERFHIITGWRFRKQLFRKLIVFGIPAGTHNLVDMLGITTFVMVAGLFGMRAQFATNMALNMNLFLFLPAIGMHVAASILAGQFCGAKNYRAVERITSAAFLLVALYMLPICIMYAFFPGVMLEYFRGNMGPEQWESVFSLTRILMWFVVAYTIGDTFMIVYTGVLKGAGDTHFVMWLSLITSITVLVVPCVLLAIFRESFSDTAGVLLAWGFFSLFVSVIGAASAIRFVRGKWRDIELVGDDEITVMMGLEDQLVQEKGAQGIFPV